MTNYADTQTRRLTDAPGLATDRLSTDRRVATVMGSRSQWQFTCDRSSRVSKRAAPSFTLGAMRGTALAAHKEEVRKGG